MIRLVQFLSLVVSSVGGDVSGEKSQGSDGSDARSAHRRLLAPAKSAGRIGWTWTRMARA